MVENGIIKVQIGSRYMEQCATLREGIRRGTLVGMLEQTERQACYLCAQRIEDRVRVVEIPCELGVEKYFIDTKCYDDARAVEYREGRMLQ